LESSTQKKFPKLLANNIALAMLIEVLVGVLIELASYCLQFNYAFLDKSEFTLASIASWQGCNLHVFLDILKKQYESFSKKPH
jgi:hypothetical protein